ncbi:hypothetical protein [Cognatishimia activa]|uniref:HupE / UreJ protein n=1 Tax=Cognatishimia activa TaxID=1715691 RepID=A0A0N7MBY9_9RHOB|nr:hypothetical protein [Cognatishimia activa]CUI76308.1 hypothetical protein TA5113_01382 [Cognatishimia activa]CUK26736.1 hypothetical protein TA5114_02553 [Cognatishimia activa]
MKRSLMTIVGLLVASPAFAHVDGHFHTHGIENTLILALLAAGTAYLLWKR